MPYQLKRYNKNNSLKNIFSAFAAAYQPELVAEEAIPQDEIELAMAGEDYQAPPEQIQYPTYKTPSGWQNFITGGRAGSDATRFNFQSVLQKAKAQEAMKQLIQKAATDRTSAIDQANFNTAHTEGRFINPESTAARSAWESSSEGIESLRQQNLTNRAKQGILNRVGVANAQGQEFTNDVAPFKFESDLALSDANAAAARANAEATGIENRYLPTKLESLQKALDVEMGFKIPEHVAKMSETGAKIRGLDANSFSQERQNASSYFSLGSGLFETPNGPGIVGPGLAPTEGGVVYTDPITNQRKRSVPTPAVPPQLYPLNELENRPVTPSVVPSNVKPSPDAVRVRSDSGKLGWKLPDGTVIPDK